MMDEFTFNQNNIKVLLQFLRFIDALNLILSSDFITFSYKKSRFSNTIDQK